MSSVWPTRFHPPVQHHHVVELQALGAVGGEQEQTPLFPVHLVAPLGQPFYEVVVHRRFVAAGFQNVFVNAFPEQFDPGTDGLVIYPTVENACGHEIIFPPLQAVQTERKRPRRTFTIDDEVFELLTRLADDVDVSRSRLLEQLMSQDHEVYERLTNMAQQARAGRHQFLEHLILRAEAVWNFSRHHRLCRGLGGSCGARIQSLAIVADLRDVA